MVTLEIYKFMLVAELMPDPILLYTYIVLSIIHSYFNIYSGLGILFTFIDLIQPLDTFSTYLFHYFI